MRPRPALPNAALGHLLEAINLLSGFDEHDEKKSLVRIMRRSAGLIERAVRIMERNAAKKTS